jgi:TorA maturation chaperone TorD
MGKLDAAAGRAMSHEVRRGLERAQALRALARAFGPPRDRAQLGADLAALGARAQGSLAEALERSLAALAAAPADLEDAHQRLFGGRGGVPIRESAYADGRLVAPTELADVRGFLSAFGLVEAEGTADHLSSECELASALALKEAWARSEGWDERAEIARDAYERFLADHLLRWAPRFAACVGSAGAPDFYVAAAAALVAFLEEEGMRLGLDLEPARGGLPPAPPDEAGCGGCPAACPDATS